MQAEFPPLPPDIAEAPFPTDALPPLLAALVEAHVSSRDIDPAVVGTMMLGLTAGAIGRGGVVRDALPGEITPVNLYTLIAAPQAYGKGVLNALAAPVDDAQRELAERWSREERPMARRRMAQIKREIAVLDGGEAEGDDDSRYCELSAELDAAERVVARPPRLSIGNFTSAGAIPELIRNGEQLMSVAAEAGDAVRIALGKFNKAGQSDADLLLAGYPNEPHSTTRMHSGTQSLRPCLTLVWAVQPSVLRELTGSQEARERGVIGRFLPVLAEREEIPEDTGHRVPVPDQLRQAWALVIRGAVALRQGQRLELRTDKEAAEAFRLFHNTTVDLRNGAFRDLAGELGRVRENAIRLAGVLTIMDWVGQLHPADAEPVLTLDHAERAIRLMKHYLGQTVRILEFGRRDTLRRRADQLMVVLMRDGGTPINQGTLNDSHGFSAGELRQICTVFASRFELQELRTGKPGRPTFTVGLRPV